MNAGTLGNISWTSLTGQSVVNVSAAKIEDLKAASKRNELDMSHMPEDTADLSDADRLAQQEEKANKKLKAFYAAGTVFDSTIRMLGGLGNFWGLVSGVTSGGLSGWTAVWAGAGSALTVTDAAFQVKTAAVNRNMSAAIEGSFSMVQGMGVMLTAMGLGRLPAIVAAGAVAGKMAYGVYRSIKAEKEKEEQKKAGEAEKEAAKTKQDAKPATGSEVAPAAAVKAATPAQPTVSAVPTTLLS